MNHTKDGRNIAEVVPSDGKEVAAICEQEVRKEMETYKCFLDFKFAKRFHSSVKCHHLITVQHAVALYFS